MSRASPAEDENDGWIRDRNKPPFWAPWQYGYDFSSGARLVVRAQIKHAVRPQVSAMDGYLHRWRIRIENMYSVDELSAIYLCM